MPIARRDAYSRLLRLTRTIDTALVSLCETVIAELPAIDEPMRARVAGALSQYATTLRDQLDPTGDFRTLAETIEVQTKEMVEARETLQRARHELKGAYTSVSETSALRTRLVQIDEHLSAIEARLKSIGPAVEAEPAN